jgi:hypothetical protein
MHSPFCKRGVILAGLLALALAAVTPATATAKPEPGAKAKGFRLFARSLGAMTINRIYLGLNSDGEVGVDSTNSSTIGGGFWPKGTPDQYIFNSGLQIAGVVGPDGGAWAGDTTGAFFFDPKGTTQHGVEVEPIYNTTDANDYANMPTAGKIAQPPDSTANLFYSLLQTDPTAADGRRTQASQGDVWFMSWDGNPSLNAGRKHPLGVVVETRGMGWNYPTGNEDIAYFIYTFYNVTTTDPNAYVGIRPEMKTILLDKAAEFQAENNAAFGVTLPTTGYTITNMYAAFATDMDVATSGQNWSSVNLPFAMGYTYADKMAPASGWTFDAATFGPPFFSAVGFAGIKYLKSPNGPGAIQLFSNTINGSPFSGAFNDPQNTIQLWRYLSANISVPAGDQPCNMGLPSTTHICWINNTQPSDMRFFQSSTGLTLPPGGQGTIVVAYIFAAPVAIPACNSAPCASIKPGTAPYLLGDPTAPNNGATSIDSLTGYMSCSDLDLSTKCEQTGTAGDEWKVVPGSLLGKAYTAQAVFDAKFLLPFAPTAPKFFLIPGDNQVTVIWQPSASETGGDPYYAVSSDVNNPLYDPNYRQFDVEGYRIYRGRVDNQDQLSLVAQFDFKGTVFKDYDGVVNAVNTCAPNLNVLTSCPVAYSAPWAPGVPRTVANDNPIVSPLTQVLPKDRLELATGLVFDSKTDTLVTGRNSGLPPLTDTGVPYVFVDEGVRNNFRYFYVVTAFDVNSLISGPSSLESPKAGTVAIVPQAPASNVVQTGTLTSAMYGRGVNQSAVFTSVPSIDQTTGTFSGPFPPANGATLGFVGQFASQVVGSSGSLTARLDSFHLGQVDLSGCCGGADQSGGKPVVFYYTLGNGTDSTKVSAALQQQLDVDASTQIFFDALKVDATLAAVYGGDGTYSLKGQFEPSIPSGPNAGDWGLGLLLGEPGFTSAEITATGATAARYNGARWFDGPSPANNEVTADPITGACGTGTGACGPAGSTVATLNFNNAGVLSGVTKIYQPLTLTMINREWRNTGETQSGARRAADYNVYWGTGGVVDSVIDVTHNVVVPFQSSNVSGGWGILNTTAQGAGGYDNRATVLTPLDWTCVEPFRSTQSGGTYSGNFFPCTSAAPFTLSGTATLGSVAFGSGDNQSTTQAKSARNTANLEAQPGFSMYVAGTITFFEMTALPAAGTVWSLRDYTGIVYGGNGTGGAGNEGPYSFAQATRPFTALGAELHTQYDVVNQVNAATNQGLEAVHTIPDPYYVTNGYETTYDNHIIKFVNLPTQATIRIYSSSGVLIRVLQYSSPENGGMLDWNVKNRNNQVVASGVYFYQIESGSARRIGRMTIVTFAK